MRKTVRQYFGTKANSSKNMMLYVFAGGALDDVEATILDLFSNSIAFVQVNYLVAALR